MKVYIAADSRLQQVVCRLRDELRGQGIHVTSRWLDVVLEGNGKAYSETELWQGAEICLADIREADWLIAFNPSTHHRSGTGGRHVELGYAIARNMPIMYVGQVKENVFHHLPQVKVSITELGMEVPEIALAIHDCLSLLNISRKQSER